MLKNVKIADFPNARRPVQAAGTVVPISKFHSKDLKAQISNFVLEAAALQAIFDPQNRKIRGTVKWPIFQFNVKQIGALTEKHRNRPDVKN